MAFNGQPLKATIPCDKGEHESFINADRRSGVPPLFYKLCGETPHLR
jgi:hypothetical protein